MSATPPGNHGDTVFASGGSGMVQRVIREVGGGSNYPTLTKMNYPDWALLMKVKLRVRSLWSAVDKGGGDLHEDMMALDVLSNAVTPGF
jgi:hypothetical protein